MDNDLFLLPVKVELLRLGYALPSQPVGVVIRGGGVVTQAVKGNSLEKRISNI